MQAALQHDCAVTVTDVIDVDGAPGLILEFVDGPTLDEWLATDPSRAQRLDLFRQVVSAVKAAHAMGLVHRDLKPGNVLVQSRPEGPRAKVTDFGIAKVLSEGDEVGQTRSGTAMGTPAYMAPEQMRDASTVDHRADIWALGAILYELVTGEVALGQGTLVETWERAKTADFQDPTTRVADLDPNIATAIRRALEPDRDRRIADCDALLAVLNGVADKAAVPPPAPRRGPAGSRGPLVAVLGGLALAVGAGAFGGAALLWGLSGSSEPVACETGWFGTVGYARGSGFFRWDEGDVWRLPRRIDVYDAVPDSEDAGEPSCFLPAGTSVTLSEHPTKAAGRTWVRVGASSFTLPEQDD